MNHYDTHIEKLFVRALELRHTVSHLRSVLNSSIKSFETVNDFDFISASALVITDWTGPTDNGGDLVNYTGIRKITYKDRYVQEVEEIISNECCNAFSQSFEALKRFFKDCVFTKIKSDPEYCKILKIENCGEFKRTEIPGGDTLFEWIKKGCRPLFEDFSSNNNKDLKFKEYWTVLSQVRNSIVHSSSVIKIEKLKITDYHFAIFNHLFDHQIVDSQTLKIKLNYQKLDRLLNRVVEFGFQIFKMLSKNENLEWNILK